MQVLAILSMVIPIFLQGMTLALLTTRGLWTRFRWFSVYLVYELVEEILRLVSLGQGHLAYYVIYWATSALAVLFTFLAARESFLNSLGVLGRYRWFRWAFWGAIAVAAAYSVGKALFWRAGQLQLLIPQVPRPMDLINSGEETFEYLVMAAALVYFVAVSALKVKNRQWESGVLFGFAMGAVLSNFGSITLSIFGTKFPLVNKWTSPMAYIIGAIIWVVTFCRPDQERLESPVNLTPEQMLDDLVSYRTFVDRVRVFLRRETET